MSSIDFGKQSLALITGASKGIGKAIAVELSRRLCQNSVLILVARSQIGLEETKNQISEVDKSLTVLTYVLDLSKPRIEEYNTLCRNIIDSVKLSELEYSLIFHNAGHVGTLKLTTDLDDLLKWRDYYDLNFFSASLLTSAFLKNFEPISRKSVIVNVTSLCGRSPVMNLGMYGSAKAARDLFFKVLALEKPTIIVLNYSPGPVDTEMFNSIVTDAQTQEVREAFKKVKDTKVLNAAETVNRMLEIMEKGDYKSGDTIDYFDKV